MQRQSLYGHNRPHCINVFLLWRCLYCTQCTARRYAFATPSSMKPTQFSYPGGSINQIPGEATVCGDCRMTPFYEVEAVRQGGGAVVELLDGPPTRRHTDMCDMCDCRTAGSRRWRSCGATPTTSTPTLPACQQEARAPSMR